MNIFTSNELSLTQEAKKWICGNWEAFAMCLLNIEGRSGPIWLDLGRPLRLRYIRYRLLDLGRQITNSPVAKVSRWLSNFKNWDGLWLIYSIIRFWYVFKTNKYSAQKLSEVLCNAFQNLQQFKSYINSLNVSISLSRSLHRMNRIIAYLRGFKKFSRQLSNPLSLGN